MKHLAPDTRAPALIHINGGVVGVNDEIPYTEAVRGLTVLPPLAGGPTRQHSVMHGLEALAHHKPEYVLIHDAARPLVSAETIGLVIAALRDGADAAVPLLPVADTLKQAMGSKRLTFNYRPMSDELSRLSILLASEFLARNGLLTKPIDDKFFAF